MLQMLENTVVDDMRRQVRHLSPVPPSEATGRVASVYRQAREEFQLAPPITMFSQAPDLLAAAWAIVRESQIAPGQVERWHKEAIAGAVSVGNACPYCVDAHVGLVHAAGQHQVAAHVRAGTIEQLEDPELKALIAWVAAMEVPGSDLLNDPPFTDTQQAEVLGTALTYQFVNRVVHVFLTSSPMPVDLGGFGRRMFGATLGKRMLNRTGPPGASGSLLPDPQQRVAWAAGQPHIECAWGQFYDAIDAAGERSVPPAVRAVVLERVGAWTGETMPLSSRWTEPYTAELGDAQPLARLLLLAALSSYQVTPEDVEAVDLHSEAALIEACSWSAGVATRRIASWVPARRGTGRDLDAAG